MVMRVSNNEMGSCVQRREEFRNNNGTVYSERFSDEESSRYVVYSYGPHFPMYVYDYAYECWFGNKDRYSQTTSCHKSQCQPSGNVIYVDTHTMCQLASGVRKNIANRILHGMAKATKGD